MTQPRLAIIGVGDVAQRDYLAEFHRISDRAEITVVCGHSPDRVQRIAAEYGVPEWSVDYSQAIAADVDAVVNLTPFALHHQITLAALRAGRHVYTEKPLAATVAEARELDRVAQELDRTLVCAPSIMLFPQLTMVRDLLDSGSIGSIVSAHAHALGGVPPWEGYDSDPSPFFMAGTGPLVDMGVYPLHALTGLLGPVTSVAAVSTRTRESFTVTDGPHAGLTVPVEVDDVWHLALQVGQAVASVEVNFATVPSSAPECELRGESGAVAFSLLDVSQPVSVLQPSGEWVVTDVPHRRAAGPDHILGIEHLIDCISTGAAPIPSAAHAIHVLGVIEAARASAKRGEIIEVTATPMETVHE